MSVENSQSKPGILIVDDVVSARRILIKLLQKGGISARIIEAPNGVAALSAVQAGGIGLIISDWEMPEMTGLELLQKVREDSSLKDIPFLMITSNSDAAKVAEAAHLKVSAFLVKPFNQRLLCEKVRALINASLKI